MSNAFLACDCGHTLYHHTDRGADTDAGLCLMEGCECDEFIEGESDEIGSAR